jgi:hypothetical protein
MIIPSWENAALVVKVLSALRIRRSSSSLQYPQDLAFPSDLPMPLGGLSDRRVVPSIAESSAEMGGRHSAEAQ